MENVNSKFSAYSLNTILNVTKIHTMFYYEFPRSHRFSGEEHDFYELIYVDKGECIITDGDRSINMSVGEAYLVHPNVFHTLSGNDAHNFNVFIISFTCKSKLLALFPSEIFEITPALRSIISKIIKECHKSFNIPIIDKNVLEIHPKQDAPIGSRQLIKLYLEEFFITLLRNEYERSNASRILSLLGSKEEASQSLIESVKKYLLDNLDKKITLTEICKSFNYSKNYICENFKLSTGCSIIEYFNRAKIEKAKDLLRDKKYTISKISEMLGFSSPAYFSKAFKKVTGVSPMEYEHSLRSLWS